MRHIRSIRLGIRGVKALTSLSLEEKRAAVQLSQLMQREINNHPDDPHPKDRVYSTSMHRDWLAYAVYFMRNEGINPVEMDRAEEVVFQAMDWVD